EKYQPKGDYADGESFSVLELESRMLSPDGSIAMLANNNKASGVWDEMAQRLLWGFDSAGKLTHGTIPMDRTSGFGTAAAKNTGNGTGQIPDMSYFPFSGKGTDSIVVTLPNGLIIQSFSREFASGANVGEGNKVGVQFPAAFPNKVVAVVCTKASYVQILVSCEDISLSGFNAIAMKVVTLDLLYSKTQFIAVGY
uniref:gp53-like domain-containing protein n=1 Tax=Morganella morganii TaxID=582 RepID=UPI003D3016B6